MQINIRKGKHTIRLDATEERKILEMLDFVTDIPSGLCLDVERLVLRDALIGFAATVIPDCQNETTKPAE